MKPKDLEKYELTETEWRAISQGDLEVIKSKSNPGLCYALAFAHGVFEALTFLNEKYLGIALLIAAENNQLESATYLIENYLESIPDATFGPALCISAKNDYLLITFLILLNALKNISDDDISTALFHVARHQMLVKVDKNQLDKILKQAIVQGKISLVNFILENTGTNFTEEDMRALIFMAASDNQPEVLLSLLIFYKKKITESAWLPYPPTDDFDTALFEATENGFADIIRLLLAHCDEFLTLEVIGISFIQTAEGGHAQATQAFIDSAQNHKISYKHLCLAHAKASENSQNDTVTVLSNALKIRLSTEENLAAVLTLIAEYGCFSSLPILLNIENPKITSRDLEEGLQTAAALGHFAFVRELYLSRKSHFSEKAIMLALALSDSSIRLDLEALFADPLPPDNVLHFAYSNRQTSTTTENDQSNDFLQTLGSLSLTKRKIQKGHLPVRG